ncbi:MAG: Glycine cleavage system H protein [Candidatus Bipolaricaulis sibiricus]|uniref:Glycine cleavage system H protein n=1 Tax=Bipolaricaulis sibiricus TaxID=2501609 RepID=A0A410FTG9_BIPS1|nr:MAG: Glycine cleavage system H protein [Candidatus Bipolaricaulis sibiricus]
MTATEFRYTKDHEWVRLEGDKAWVGITDHAQKQLGDIVFVELPPVGKVVRLGETVASVESVKAVGEVGAPLSGVVLEVNQALSASPDLVNKDPQGQGWLFTLRISTPSELSALLDAKAYEALVASGG